ncbi:cysteine and glycine-rich protein 2-like [Ptychodera flava]|uniref:cysteine and glycine-rich protein 2-like n=1 Tax=Ptychodera flava TaxID=63121 RepID=UPI00396A225D
MPRWGGGVQCGRCGKSVYQAEEVSGAGQKWHKLCFSCADCNKLLDSTTVASHENQIYCRSCYGKHYGPKGYGYGGGAGVLSMEGGSKAAPQTWKSSGNGSGAGSRFGASGEKCPRCGKTVYMAEKVIGAGSSWHKVCFTCASCNKSLDSTTCNDKEGEIFCKACYGKNFGPKGVGYGGGAGALQHTQ